MLSTVLAGTEIRVSRLSFGTASLHHLLSRRSRQRLLDTAVGSGFTHFDTAPLYGNGLAESELGALLSRTTAKLTVATKFGLYPPFEASGSAVRLWANRLARRAARRPDLPVPDWTPAAAEASLTRSLRRLRRDQVDILFLHEPEHSAIDSETMLAWLERQRERGLIASWGIAGTARQALPWLETSHPIARVLQIRDGIAGAEADVLRRHEREMQFTYGYLSEPATGGVQQRPEAALRAALRRNRRGSILVATRRRERVPWLAAMAETRDADTFA